ncbi:3'-RNA ribose 2'-O-methyltransferase, Hen [Parasponia andersonii]|uniref:Small RNA 2'-O-methyltransferase n=1 Tax=Parasponia andersonii TaxID=3476 RepID=A0A2P5AEX5_PARAD|nr:3'-RNA ribose 2'-O-methyltransferase, Hen [Parasponia andersonii]
MEIGGSQGAAVRKSALTPKAIIYQKFGTEAWYKVEEVQESNQNECPGLAITQKGPCLYRCTLQLPEISVVSGTFKKKKEAEQSASELALEKLGINPAAYNPTEQDPLDALVGRVKYLFSDEVGYCAVIDAWEFNFLTSLHPLSGHFRAALQREGDLYGCVPVSVIAFLDSKLSSLSKLIDPKVELNPYKVISYVMKAAARSSGIVHTSEEQLWVRRQNPYSLEITDSAFQQSGSPGIFPIEAIYIPCSNEKNINVVKLNVSSTDYYLDVIANQLGLVDTSKVLITRPIGRTSSEVRLYFAALEFMLELSSDISNAKRDMHSDGSCNTRASYLSGEDIYGDAILASIGYTWKSKDLFHEDLSMQSYYRMVLSKVPSGVYKLSRGAVLAADLPLAFTTRTNWRGSFPRDVLCTFCRQHRLSEPVFSTVSISKAPSKTSGLHKKLKVKDSAVEETDCANGSITAAGAKEAVESGVTFRCEVKIYSKFQDLLIECSPKDSYKKQGDSIQNASLKVLTWLDAYFKNLDIPVERLNCSVCELDIKFNPKSVFEAFALCRPIQFFQHRESPDGRLDESNAMPGQGICGPDSGVSPSNGSLSCISYSVMLVIRSDNTKVLLESSDDFEFEMGSRSVIHQIEAAVMQMTVGQSAFLLADMPSPEFILAAADDSERILSALSSKDCCLKYAITLYRVTEPLEDRMEQALFSPPLSKQRVEYALHHIKQTSATTLVDFGCGSGSLLDSLLNYQTSLENIVGVDISLKSLIRAAKILNSKLNANSGVDMPSAGIKSAILYDGSITVFDSRLCGFDIGTCLEVIEHMEEDQAWLFGDVVLSYFRPKILIVSTPNYEYNVILQGSNLSSQEEDPDDKGQSQACKFRNHDHKFEWTREQFNHWASDLATKHNYSVEFGGVGGSAGVEPGFASQIAVFRSGTAPILLDDSQNIADSEHLSVVWEWNSSTRS